MLVVNRDKANNADMMSAQKRLHTQVVKHFAVWSLNFRALKSEADKGVILSTNSSVLEWKIIFLSVVLKRKCAILLLLSKQVLAVRLQPTRDDPEDELPTESTVDSWVVTNSGAVRFL